jgi:DNA repair exonuclease SbcCD ATPase subunit
MFAEKAGIPMDAHIARTKYVLGSLLISQKKDVERGRQLVEEAEKARKDIERALGTMEQMREELEFVNKALDDFGYETSATKKAYNALQSYDDKLPFWMMT